MASRLYDKMGKKEEKGPSVPKEAGKADGGIKAAESRGSATREREGGKGGAPEPGVSHKKDEAKHEPHKPAGEHGERNGMHERHAEARKALHKTHEAERRDMHGNHREEHRKMASRHEAAHKAMNDMQEQELAGGAQGTEAPGGEMPGGAPAAPAAPAGGPGAGMVPGGAQ